MVNILLYRSQGNPEGLKFYFSLCALKTNWYIKYQLVLGKKINSRCRSCLLLLLFFSSLELLQCPVSLLYTYTYRSDRRSNISLFKEIYRGLWIGISSETARLSLFMSSNFSWLRWSHRQQSLKQWSSFSLFFTFLHFWTVATIATKTMHNSKKCTTHVFMR